MNFDRSINQSINQASKQAVNQSLNQSLNRSEDQWSQNQGDVSAQAQQGRQTNATVK